MSAIVIGLLALGLAALSGFLSITEARLARRPAATQSVAPSDASTPPQPAPNADATPCIVAMQARCACGDPLERHDRGPCAGCACDGFAYAGGLVRAG